MALSLFRAWTPLSALCLSALAASGADFSIADFGARTDGTLCTHAVEGAMAACEKAGGGRVVVPKGRWLTGAIRFRSNCELFLSEGAEVLFSQKPADYLPAVHTSWEGIECWNYCPLVYAYCCTNVAITGTGTLRAYEGEWQKTAWYPWVCQENGVGAARRQLYDWGATNAPVELRQIWKMENANTRPHFVQFNRCKGVRWDGFKVRNSPFWTLHLYLCDGVEVRGLDVCAHGNNNDGIDIEMSRNVIVENCTFDQGDDGVVIKSGRNQDAWRLHTPTENVLIRNCYVKNAHTVLGIGSEISGGVRNVRMENCRAETPHRVFYLKTNHRRGGFLENITCEDVTCREASESVFEIDTDVLYEWAKFPDYKVAITRISGIRARNISVGTAKDVVRLKGDARLPPRNIVAEGLVVDKVTGVWQDVKNVDGFSHVATAATGASALAQVVQANCGKCAKTEYERYYAELEAADKAADSAWDAVANRAQFDARRRALREKFLSDVGAFPERTPLAACVVATVPRKGYRVEKVLFESRPGFHVPALVYVPDAVRFAPPYPAVLVTCGHSENGKACADYQRACVMGANEGFLMMICDPIDQGERLMSTDGNCCGGHNQFGAKAHGLGLSAAHFRIWDGMRCLDYLQSRPDVKADRLGIMGNSGGGTMTALIAAADPRVKAAAPSCYITTIRDVVRTIGPQDAEQCVWRQLKDGINHASLVLMAEAAVRLQFSDDDFFPIAGARSTYDIVRRTAERVGLGARYSATVVRGPHGWKESSRRSSLDWMRQWLMDELPSGRTDADYVALDGLFDAATADCGLSDAEAKVAPGGSVLNLLGERTVSDLLVDHAIGAKTPRLVFREAVPLRHSFYGAKSAAEENAVLCLMLGKNLVEERTKEILAQARARMARGEPKPVLVAEDAWIKPAERAFAKAPELFVGFCPLGEGVFRTSVRDSEGGAGTEKDPLKILMIGNSFSVQMVEHLPPVAKDLGLKADVCSLYIGGCPLSKHWKNVCAPTSTPYSVTRSIDGQLQKEFRGNIPDVLKSEKWDVVTLQQASHESWKSASYHPFGDDLVKYVREHAPQAKIVVHETWSYTPWDRRFKDWKIDQNEMYAKLHAAYGDFAKGYGFDVIPTGTAVQLVRQELPVKYAENSLGGDVVGSCSFVQEDGKWTPKGDVFHMGPDGNYLQALVWTAKLFGADVAKCTYKPAEMSEARAAFLRKMAMKAVNSARRSVSRPRFVNGE